MNELELIEWLSVRTYWSIRNGHAGFYMAPHLVRYSVKAEIRLSHQSIKFQANLKHTLKEALVEVKNLVEHWYMINAPEYL